jgi:hypothetical protein
VNDEHDIPVDPALAEVWQDMDPEERLRLLLAEGEQPPAELSENVRRLYRRPDRDTEGDSRDAVT